jgi:hypothetical protein
VLRRLIVFQIAGADSRVAGATSMLKIRSPFASNKNFCSALAVFSVRKENHLLEPCRRQGFAEAVRAIPRVEPVFGMVQTRVTKETTLVQGGGARASPPVKLLSLCLAIDCSLQKRVQRGVQGGCQTNFSCYSCRWLLNHAQFLMIAHYAQYWWKDVCGGNVKQASTGSTHRQELPHGPSAACE